jgi:hypothetical protein
MRLPLRCVARAGSRGRMSPLKSAAARLSRQIATASGFALDLRCSGEPSSMRTRRHAGSHGRSQVRPRMPGKTFDFQLTR